MLETVNMAGNEQQTVNFGILFCRICINSHNKSFSCDGSMWLCEG